jgi:hypothetical protein
MTRREAIQSTIDWLNGEIADNQKMKLEKMVDDSDDGRRNLQYINDRLADLEIQLHRARVDLRALDDE